MSDASDAIFNAFHELLPIESYVHLMCFAHVERNVFKHLIQLKLSIKKRNEIASLVKGFLKKLRFARSLSEWKENYTLMQESCKVNGAEKFFAYFEDTWGNNGKFTSNWQAYLTPPGFPVTNNSIESFNKQIKSHQYTSRERLAAGELFGIFADIIEDYGSGQFKKPFLTNRPFGAALAKKAIENKKNSNTQQMSETKQ
ncbi:hypothetical protein O9G_005737 [Rozella allomycis CSF55]|uniref:MULE transposase domain-containing protein n=1 Tax=Rozella allomycis (strain CSF55) TaxID=988480 RepID=A0A075APB1_ROZAC|nr:hypothetical protein O9G_005737 [Rozella allomycis CSF55]|eukprot:EPZ31896.1 hypothetical protein O9G_005737 [Rozella allomycis CSF55]